MKRALACLIVVCALGASACSTSADTSTTTLTTAPTSPLVVENLSGTVQPGGNDAHTFTVISNNAGITMDLTSAGPPSTITMGFGVGSIVGSTCSPLAGGTVVTVAGPTPQLSGTIPAGTYCFLVADVGNAGGPITYTAVVQHY